MTSLTIKNIPDDLYEALKTHAAQHHRSLNKEIIHQLEYAMKLKRNAEETLKTAQGIRESIRGYTLTNNILNKAKVKGRK